MTTHKDLGEQALSSGKHVFIEKPMTSNSFDAKLLLETAKKFNRKLAVGHVFQFAPAVRKIKQLLNEHAIGKVMHITSSRINLGPPKSEVDVIWDLGPHDFSIILYLLDEIPIKVESQKKHYSFNELYSYKPDQKIKLQKLINNAHIDLYFKSGITSHIHLSWLSSNKTRLMQIFGTEGSIIYDEMLALDGKLKLYGKGVDNRVNSGTSGSKKLSYQSGDIRMLMLEQHEPLRMECESFINAIRFNTDLINDGKIGMEVVKLLELVSPPFQVNK